MRLSQKVTAVALGLVMASSLAIVAVQTTGILTRAENTYAGAYFKVTSTDQMTDLCGTNGSKYLIVCEEAGVAFNGSLTTLDAVSNTVPITIAGNGLIANSATLEAAQFTIDRESTFIISASGYGIGRTSDSNGLQSNNNPSYYDSYTHTFSFDSSDNANVLSVGGAYLRYNSASNQNRFRYFKSSSYTSQKPIQLYKLQRDLTANGSTPIDPEDPYTPTHAGTENDPYDMEDAFNIIKESTGYSENEIYITGTVQTITYHNEKYNSYTAIISDTESEHTVTVYSGTIDENAGYTDLQEGDFIIARGHYTYYNNTTAELAGTSGVSYPVFVSITR